MVEVLVRTDVQPLPERSIRIQVYGVQSTSVRPYGHLLCTVLVRYARVFTVQKVHACPQANMPSDNGDATPPPCPTLHTNKPVTMFASDGACSCATFEQIRALQSDFANRRDWNQYHTPRNLVLALVGEVGELSEIFQWRGDGACKPGLPEWSDKDKVHLSEELADVALYLIRLSERCGIDLPLAIESKLKKNNDKYPADKGTVLHCTHTHTCTHTYTNYKRLT